MHKSTLLLLLPLLSGCKDMVNLVVSKEYPVRHLHTLPAERTDPPSETKIDGVLAVKPFTIDTRFEGPEFVYRRPGLPTKEKVETDLVESDFYEAFFVPPREMVTDRARSWFAQAGIFRTVTGMSSIVQPTHFLEGHISQLWVDMRTIPPTAVLEVQFILAKEGKSSATIVFTKSYEKSVKMAADTPEDAVKTWDAELTEVMRSLESDLIKLPKDQPEQHLHTIAAERIGEPSKIRKSGILAVKPFTIDTRFEGAKFVYFKNGTNVEPDNTGAFFVPPREMVTDAARSWLTRACIFESVTGTSSMVPPTFFLEGHVAQLWVDTRTTPPMAVIEVQFILAKEGKKSATIVFTRSYGKPVQMTEDTPEAAAKAWGEELTRVMGELEKDLVDLTNDNSEPHLHAIAPERGGEPSKIRKGGILAVKPFTIDPRFEGDGFVYRKPGAKVESDSKEAFFVPPGQMVTDAARAWLTRACIFDAVTGLSSVVPPTYFLEGHVEQLWIDSRTKQPMAVIEVQFILAKAGTNSATIVFTKSYGKPVPMTEDTPEAAVKMWDAELARVMGELEVDLLNKIGE